MTGSMAHRVMSRRRSNSVAFGAKRTFSEPNLQNRIYDYAYHGRARDHSRSPTVSSTRSCAVPHRWMRHDLKKSGSATRESHQSTACQNPTRLVCHIPRALVHVNSSSSKADACVQFQSTTNCADRAADVPDHSASRAAFIVELDEVRKAECRELRPIGMVAVRFNIGHATLHDHGY